MSGCSSALPLGPDGWRAQSPPCDSMVRPALPGDAPMALSAPAPSTHPDAQDLPAASAHPFQALPRAAPHALLAPHRCRTLSCLVASHGLGPSWAGEGACTVRSMRSTAEVLRTHCHPRGCCCLKRHPELTPLPRLHWPESLFPWRRLRGHRVTAPRPGLWYPKCPLQPRAPGVPGCRKATSQAAHIT